VRLRAAGGKGDAWQISIPGNSGGGDEYCLIICQVLVALMKSMTAKLPPPEFIDTRYGMLPQILY